MTFSRRVNVNCIPPWKSKLRKKNDFHSGRQNVNCRLSILSASIHFVYLNPLLSDSVRVKKTLDAPFNWNESLFLHSLGRFQSDVERYHDVSIFDMDSISLKFIECSLNGMNEREYLLIHIKFSNIDYEFSFKWISVKRKKGKKIESISVHWQFNKACTNWLLVILFIFIGFVEFIYFCMRSMPHDIMA